MTFLVGSYGGNTAKSGGGSRPGTAFGFRFRNRLSGPLDLVIGTSYIGSSRTLIDPTKPDSIRRSGPVDLNMIAADVGISLTLTGTKTWHGLAPWIGLGFGVVTPTKSATDPGGYRVATNFSFIPSLGVRLRLGPQLGLEVEARDNTMRYEWPLAYFTPSDGAGTPFPPAIIATGEKDRQLTHNFTISAGLSYRFNF